MSAANIRKDIRCDTISVRESLQLPLNQTLLKGAISYNPSSNSIQFSDGSQVLDVGATLPGSVYVFRPGYTGSSGSIFGDWEALCSAVAASELPKYIFFDNSLLATPTTPIVIPIGDWDMTGVTWITSPATLQLTVTVADGATLNGLWGIDGPFSVTYNSAAQPAITLAITALSTYRSFTLDNGANLFATGTEPFMRIT